MQILFLRDLRVNPQERERERVAVEKMREKSKRRLLRWRRW